MDATLRQMLPVSREVDTIVSPSLLEFHLENHHPRTFISSLLHTTTQLHVANLIFFVGPHQDDAEVVLPYLGRTEFLKCSLNGIRLT